jgi:hypothetical protein
MLRNLEGRVGECWALNPASAIAGRGETESTSGCTESLAPSTNKASQTLRGDSLQLHLVLPVTLDFFEGRFA